MRTNFAGLFLAVGMGLIVVLLGFGALSVAGLVGFSGSEIENEPAVCGNVAESIDSTSTAQVAMLLSPEEKVGDALFKANCAQCHAVNENIVGPALAGITKRRRIDWVVSWVHNSATVIASGDEYAVKLFNDNGKQQMPSFPLSKKEIEDIIAWVESQEATGAVATAKFISCEGAYVQ